MLHRVFPFILILSNFVFTAPASAQEVLTWTDCLAEARKNHPDLISAVESVTQEKAAKEISASGLFPQTGADLDISRAKTGNTTANTYSHGVSGTQLIFDGMKTSSEIKAASESVAAVIAMLALGEGAKTAIRAQLAALGSNLLVIRPGSPKLSGIAMESGSTTRFTFQDVETIRRMAQEVRRVSPYVSGRGRAVDHAHRRMEREGLNLFRYSGDRVLGHGRHPFWPLAGDAGLAAGPHRGAAV